jgi:hypothetical protein
MAAADLLKMTKDNIERQIETSPPIPDAIISEFKKKFKDTKDIAIPDVANGIHKVYVNSKTFLTPPQTVRAEDVTLVVESAQGR